jgi:hypothetical protein
MGAKFWMVLGRDVPKYRHATLAAAKTEAERLAKINPGCEFTVLEAVATCSVHSVNWDRLQDADSLDLADIHARPF